MSTDAQLVEMERLMRSAPEPGGLENVDMGGDVSVTKTTVESAGHATMWNTDTREPSVFNMNAVRAKIREVFPNDYDNVAMRGLPSWTATQPSEPPWRGNFTCPLHNDRPERQQYAEYGYPRCTYDVAPNEMEAQEHLRKKHPQTWRMMNEFVEEKERKAQQDDRSISRLILAKLAGVDIPESLQPEMAKIEVDPTFTLAMDDSNTDTTAVITVQLDAKGRTPEQVAEAKARGQKGAETRARKKAKREKNG